MKLRIQIFDESADGGTLNESEGLKEIISRTKEKLENTHQVARCNNREDMFLYSSLGHRDGGGRFCYRLGVDFDRLLRELRCPVCVVKWK